MNLHFPVLLEETIKLLDPRPCGLYLDGTLGLGGHARAVLSCGSNIQLAGMDQDIEALNIARQNLAGFVPFVHFFNMQFGSFEEVLKKLGWQKIDGALLDLGVSSLQLDDPGRGFSFNANGPLDMRMNRSLEISAREFINESDFEKLRFVIASYGEEPLAARIAAKIVETRKKQPVEDTLTLARLVQSVYKAKWKDGSRRNPAARTFQAIRIAVNNELIQLRLFLDNIFKWLKIGGRLAIISFHSLEDRMVKKAFQAWSKKENAGIACARILTKKPLTATDEELRLNARSSCAKLRVMEKIAEQE